MSPETRAHGRGGIRTLSSDGAQVSYRMGLHAAPAGHAVVYMFDGEMSHVPPAEYQLLEVGDWLDATWRSE